MEKGKRLKTIILLSVVCMSILFMIAGCGPSNDEIQDGKNTAQQHQDEANLQENTQKLSGSITIAGSTSVQPVSEVLAEAFMEIHDQVNVYVQGGGSSAGIKAAHEGAAQIGASSRELKDDEKSAVKELIIAKDGIAIIVHPSNDVGDLTLDQIKGIFEGSITNWKEVGGADKEIIVVTREEGSGTRGGFEEIVMDKDCPIADNAIVQSSTGAIKTIVMGDKNAIGYISLAILDEKVKAIKVEGVEISKETINDKTYKVARPFIYVTKGEPTALTKAFIDFVLSDEAQPIIEEAGLVSVK